MFLQSLYMEFLLSKLYGELGVEPTGDQRTALQNIAQFIDENQERAVFLLKGYAGTGKTTIINSIVKSLPAAKRGAELLAPTGRAAKVMTQYSGKRAFTIHKFIYQFRQQADGVQYALRENRARQTVFVVDEASMINDKSQPGTGSSLLSDLLEFVFTGYNCKLILVGDYAQLPPVGTDESPALNAQYLRTAYFLHIREANLKQVLRQAQDSQILRNATHIRQLQDEERYEIPAISHGREVVRLIEGFEVEEALNDAYREYGRDGTVIITRSNKRANMFNQQIRQRVLWQEDEISAGDFLMVVKNNYFWLDAKSKVGFIANGDIVEVLQIFEIMELYGLRFARCAIRLIDYPGEPELEAQLMLDILQKDGPSLTWNESRQLYQEVMLDYQDVPSKSKRHQLVKDNEFYNALQVKFAYAVTCHKAQGGQWPFVFVEKPWLPDGNPDLDYLRWLYTAFTRAQEKLFLLGFTGEYFPED